MTKNLFLCFIFCGCSIADTAQSSKNTSSVEAQYLDDSEISDDLEQAAEKIVSSGQTMSAAEATRQLLESIDKTVSINGPAAHTAKLSAAELYTRVKKATVIFGNAYDCGKCTRTHVGAASGYIIDENGICVTNHHVLEAYADGDSSSLAMVVRTADGKIYKVAKILASSEVNDLAVVRLETNGDKLAALPLGNAAPVGSPVYVLSHPKNMFYYFSEGIVARNNISRHRGAKEGRYQMAITADYARGSSGGPVVDSYGNLIGTVSETRSIYYEQEEHLQMVVKNTISVVALKKLLKG